jgi:hypothetical protein
MNSSSMAGIVDRPEIRRFIPIALAISLLLAACVPLPSTQEPVPATPSGQGQPSQPAETTTPAAAAAQAALAAELGVPESQITIVSAEPVEWPDACLGAATEGEMCAQVITPGYRILLEANGKQYEVHTDASGRTVRIVNP